MPWVRQMPMWKWDGLSKMKRRGRLPYLTYHRFSDFFPKVWPGYWTETEILPMPRFPQILAPPFCNSLDFHHTLPESLRDCSSSSAETINYCSRPWCTYSSCKFRFGWWPFTIDTDSLALIDYGLLRDTFAPGLKFVSFCVENHHSSIFFMYINL